MVRKSVARQFAIPAAAFWIERGVAHAHVIQGEGGLGSGFCAPPDRPGSLPRHDRGRSLGCADGRCKARSAIPPPLVTLVSNSAIVPNEPNLQPVRD